MPGGGYREILVYGLGTNVLQLHFQHVFLRERIPGFLV